MTATNAVGDLWQVPVAWGRFSCHSDLYDLHHDAIVLHPSTPKGNRDDYAGDGVERP